MDGKIPIIRFCKVVGLDDKTASDMVRVRVIPEDNDKADAFCDFAFPLLPKSFSSAKPQIGESVFVILAETNEGNSQRYYIGPVISQMHHMSFEPFFQGADSFMRGATRKPDPAAYEEGIFKKDDDVSIIGRKNCDIQVTEDDIRIRAGVKVVNELNRYVVSFNDVNPGYIKVKYHPKGLNGGTKSTTTIVSDKISLLSPSSERRVKGNKKFELTDREDLVTDEELNEIMAEAYRLPYGERLVAFLKKFVNAFCSHTHDFIKYPPNRAYTNDINAAAAEELDEGKMLSNTIRIN